MGLVGYEKFVFSAPNPNRSPVQYGRNQAQRYMEWSQERHPPPCEQSNSTSSSATGATSPDRRSSSRYSTGGHNTTPYWDDQRSHNSWSSHTTPTLSSRCQDLRESSLSTEASSNQTNVTMTSTKFVTPSEQSK